TGGALSHYLVRGAGLSERCPSLGRSPTAYLHTDRCRTKRRSPLSPPRANRQPRGGYRSAECLLGGRVYGSGQGGGIGAGIELAVCQGWRLAAPQYAFARRDGERLARRISRRYVEGRGSYLPKPAGSKG